MARTLAVQANGREGGQGRTQPGRRSSDAESALVPTLRSYATVFFVSILGLYLYTYSWVRLAHNFSIQLTTPLYFNNLVSQTETL